MCYLVIVRDKRDFVLLIHVCSFIIIQLTRFILMKSVMCTGIFAFICHYTQEKSL